MIASYKLYKAVVLLLKANANPNLQMDNGATPLHIASMNHNTDAITLLLKANANPNLRMHGQTDAISLVPNANAGLNLSAENGGTPLHLASQNGHTDSICLLLKANC